jgi:hypothetical protein
MFWSTSAAMAIKADMTSRFMPCFECGANITIKTAVTTSTSSIGLEFMSLIGVGAAVNQNDFTACCADSVSGNAHLHSDVLLLFFPSVVGEHKHRKHKTHQQNQADGYVFDDFHNGLSEWRNGGTV